MPTVVRVDGFRVLVLLPPREHRPPHVHVVRAGSEVVVLLPSAEVREIRGMGDVDVAHAIEIVETHMTDCIRLWEEIHGPIR